MDLISIPALLPFVERTLQSTAGDPETRAHAENFALDERPPLEGVRLYGGHFGSTVVTDLDVWTGRHCGYVREEIRLGVDEPRTPWTFRLENARNRLRLIDPRLYLIRVEDAGWPLRLLGASLPDLEGYVEGYGRGDAAAEAWLDAFTATWNGQRDNRPVYATTEIEVRDILEENVPQWAERLRDRLGLGHYSRTPGTPPLVILAMRYTVEEVLAAWPDNGHPAIPTVLDGDLSAHFFPSPVATPSAAGNPYYGHTVNLRPVDDPNDYQMGCELLHPRLNYRPEHVYRVGTIHTPVTQPVERARRFHLAKVRLASGRPDFGSHVFAGSVS